MRNMGPQPLRSNWRDPEDNCGLPENQHRKVRASRQPTNRSGAVRTYSFSTSRRSSTHRTLFPNPPRTVEEIRRLG